MKQSCYIKTVVVIYVLFTLAMAAVIPLSYDESYYWVLSRQLSFGYFDHPPAFAVLIRLGTFFSDTEFGVRLFFVLLHFATIGVLTATARLYQKIYLANTAFSTPLWAVSLGSLFLFQLTHFFATPDIPLLFFSVCWLWLYLRFLQKETLPAAILLGVAAALMLYSKYHAVLLLGFVVLSNLSLLRSRYFYVAVATAALLFLPHIGWQFSHDFPTLRYHFVERSAEPFSWTNVGYYLIAQAVVVSPVLVFLIFYYKKLSASDKFFRSMVFLTVGFYLFFFLMTLKGTVEAHWTLLVSLSFSVLLYLFLLKNRSYFSLIKKAAICTTALTALIQIEMYSGLLSATFHLQNEFYRAKKWAAEIGKQCEGDAVLFINSYQQAARFSFYTHRLGWSVNNLFGRKNHYSLQPSDSIFARKKVAIVSGYDFGFRDKITVLDDTLFVKTTDTFCFYEHLRIRSSENHFSTKASSSIAVTLTAEKKYNFPIRHTFWQQPQVQVNVFQGKKWISYENTDWIVSDSNFRQPHRVSFKAPAEKGKYQCYFGIVYSGMPAGFNSIGYPLVVE